MRVDRHADDPPGHLAHEGVARGEERRVRPAVAERHAESLRVAEHDVGAHLAGRREQRQRQQVGADRDEHARVVRPRDERRQIAQLAALVRILQQHAEDAAASNAICVHRPDLQLDAERLGARPQDLDASAESSDR